MTHGLGTKGPLTLFRPLLTVLLALPLLSPPQSIAGGVTQVSAGGSHSCAVTSNGSVSCWGSNADGQLGDGSFRDHPTLTPVAGVGGAVQVTAGGHHSCALLTGGTVACWGDNRNGQLGNGSTVGATGPAEVVGLSTVRQVSAAEGHTCAVLANGRVACWGNNASGRLGDGTTEDRPAPTFVEGITGASEVASGGGHTCALISGGEVRCWGYGYYGELGYGGTNQSIRPVAVTGISNAVHIAAGSYHSCAVLADGSVRCWGSNANGQLGNGTTMKATVPTAVPGIGTATQLAAGDSHTCVLLAAGTLRCWGYNYAGELGVAYGTLGFPFGLTAPAIVVGIAGATSVTAGSNHSCALLADAGIHCWGANGGGQLGDGTTLNRSTAVRIPMPNNVPAPLLVGSPPVYTNLKAATFRLPSAEHRALSCSIDGSPFSGCSNVVTYRTLADGSHAFRVRATETSGISAISGWVWLVDTAAPRLLRRASTAKVRSAAATSYRLTTRDDASGIAKVEYSTAVLTPPSAARYRPSRTVPFATPLVIRTTAAIRWVRLADAAGNWSRWFRG